MNIAKKKYSILVIISLIIVAILAVTLMQLQNKNSVEVQAAYVPIAEGTWQDDFTSSNYDYYNLAFKEYNLERNGATPSTALIIKTPEDLAYIAYLTLNNKGVETRKYYELGNDINLAGKNWKPMGNANTNERSFMGVIDGKGFAINNLTILDSNEHYQGFIAYAKSDKNHPTIKQNEFKNIIFNNVYITGTGYNYASLISYSYGGLIIDNVTVNGNVESFYTSSSYLAGIVSRIVPLDGCVNITNVVNNATLNNTGNYTGGIVAHIDLSTVVTVDGVNTYPYLDNQDIIISNAINNGTIYGQEVIAGLIGEAHYVKLLDSKNSGKIYGSKVAASVAGGLIGRVQYGLEIDNCYNEGLVEGLHIGGLVGQIGYNDSIRDDISIKNSYNAGQIFATNNAGGLVYYVNFGSEAEMSQENFKLTVEDSYNIGELESGASVAGIICNIRGNVTLTNVYNVANLSTESTGQTAGLIAIHNMGVLEILNCYNLGNLISGLNSYVGGLVASVNNNLSNNWVSIGGELIIENSYNLGDVEGTNSAGLVAYVRGAFNIENCFNLGNITGSSNYAGGLVGLAYVFTHDIFQDSVIFRSYNTGYVIGANYNGGLISQVNFYLGNTTGDFTDEASVDNHIRRDVIITECFNAGKIYESTYKAGGLVGRVQFSTIEDTGGNIIRTQAVSFEKSFSVNDKDDIILDQYGNFDPTENLNLIGSFSNNNYNQGETGRLIIIDKNQEDVEISKILSLQELGTKSIYESVGYDFDNIWAMPNASGTGNNGAPYLKDFGLTVTLNIGDEIREYNAVYKEALNLRADLNGKTFIGWSNTLDIQDENYVFYPVNTPIYLINENINLYANFITTEYFKIIVEPAGTSSIEATYEAIYEQDGYLNGFTIDSIFNNQFLLTVDPDDVNFEGWQVWKQLDENNPSIGKWIPLLTKSRTLSLLDYPVDQEFIFEYVMFYETEQIFGDYSIFGELKIRAAKKTVDIMVTASSNNSAFGQIKIADRNVSYTGQFTLQDGVEVMLQGMPIDHYKTTKFQVTYSYVDEDENLINIPLFENLIADNNIAMFTLNFDQFGLPSTAKNFKINVKVYFEKISYEVILNAKLSDGSTQDISHLVSVGTSDLFIELDERANIEFTAKDLETIGDTHQFRFISWNIYNHLTNKYDEFNFGKNENNDYIFENKNVIDNTFLNKYISEEEIIIIAKYAIDYKVSILCGNGGYLDINVAEVNSSTSNSYAEINGLYFEKGSVINITAYPNIYYLFDGFNGAECGVINEQDEKNLNIVLNSPVNVTANFTEDVYQVIVRAIDINNEDALNDAEIDLLINNNEGDEVRLDDNINVENIEAPSGYRFETFIFKNGDREKPVGDGQVVDSDFLRDYRTINNQIIIIAYYVKQYELNIIIPEQQQNMGNFILKAYNSTNSSYEEISNTSKIFDIGTKLQIEAQVNQHFNFANFKTLNNLEKDSENNRIANITLRNDRTLHLEFTPIVYTINFTPDVRGAGTLDISTDTFKVGDVVVIMFTPDSGQSVKSWTVNDININDLKDVDYAQVTDNSITITITEEWFSQYGTNLVSIVETQLSSGIMLAIILVGTVIPILLAILILFFILNRRKKKIITAELKALELNRYKMDASSFFKDLREGKDAGVITEEDVKAEIKRRKANKNKPKN